MTPRLEHRWLTIARTGGAKVYWLLAMLATTFLTARYLGPEGRGVVAATTSWVTLFTILGHLSLPQVIVYIAAGKERASWLPVTVGTVLTIVAASTVAGWAAAAVGYALSNGSMFRHLPPLVLLLGFAALPLTLWVESGNSILLALGAIDVVNRAQVLGGTVGVALLWLLTAAAGMGVAGALLAVLAGHSVVVFVGMRRILAEAPQIHFSRTMVGELLRSGAKMHLNAIGAFLGLQASVLIINAYHSPAATAHYQLALQLFNVIAMIPTVAVMLTYPAIAKLGPDGAWPQQRRLLLEATAVTIAVSALGFFAARPVIATLIGDDFLPALPVFRILLLGVIGMALSVVMGSQWIARGLFLPVGLISMAIGALLTFANFLVIPRYGIIGAAWVMVGAYAVSILVNGGMILWVERRWRRRVVTLS